MRFGFDLCSEEVAFLRKRKKYVASALKNAFHLQQDLQDYEVCGGGGADLEFLVPSYTVLDEWSAICATYICCVGTCPYMLSTLASAAEVCYCKKH